MKIIHYLVLALTTITAFSQDFDYYGPKPFDQILLNSFNQSWDPAALTAVENRAYAVILDAESKSTVIMLDGADPTVLDLRPIADVHAGDATYGSLLRSVFQLIDGNTHKDQDPTHTDYTAFEGQYKITPFLHSYFGLDATASNSVVVGDGGTFQIEESSEMGFVLVEFDGTSSSSKIKAVSQWEYDMTIDTLAEVTDWTTKWLQISSGSLSWTTEEASASDFFLAEANDLIDLIIEDESDFNPTSIEYQVNQTTELPDEVNDITDSKLITDLAMEVEDSYESQFGSSEEASAAASAALDAIEETLTEAGATMRYPKAFYLAIRESMLSQKIASSDIYGGRLGYNTIVGVYFTNASDNLGVPHPFMVVASHAVSARPNQLIDVNRPPGGDAGVGYAESSVTRNGKLGEFLLKVPLKDYGLIYDLLDNDLTPYGDLASDFDDKMNSTTEKTVYNYAGLASVGVAVDGVTIYPAYNNNLRFAVEDAEVTHSGIHVGGGLELHYHVDGHSYNGNGINLYNITDYDDQDHPPVIGMAFDGLALFGKYEANYPSMVGADVTLDEFGGHDHGDDFGYHYHAHVQNVEASSGPNFNEHFLLVGAWKGNINNIPGFDEGKTDQFRDDEIARYLGAEYEEGEEVTLGTNQLNETVIVYPNPSN